VLIISHLAQERTVMNYRYEHFGVPVKEKQPGMIYFPEYKVWCSDYEKDPLRIEWIFFEKGSPLHPLIQTISHVCFLVEDIKKAVLGKKLLLQPTYYQGHYLAFIEENGVPIEFMQFPSNK
jgi:hypothetical protein